MAQFFVDLNIETNERPKLSATTRQLEDELAQLRRQVNEPSPHSLPVPFTFDLPCLTVFQAKCVLNHARITKLTLTITLKGAPITSFNPRLPVHSRASSLTKLFPELSSSGLIPQIKQLEEEITKARNCRETIISNCRTQFTFLYERFRALEYGSTDIILRKLTSLGFVFNTAKSSTRLDDAAKDRGTQCNSPLFRTHPYWYSVFVQFYPYGLESAAGTTPQLWSPCSPAFTMVNWHGHFLKRFISQVAIILNPKISGLLLSYPQRKYTFEGLPETFVLPWRTSTSSHTAKCSAKLKTSV